MEEVLRFGIPVGNRLASKLHESQFVRQATRDGGEIWSRANKSGQRLSGAEIVFNTCGGSRHAVCRPISEGDLSKVLAGNIQFAAAECGSILEGIVVELSWCEERKKHIVSFNVATPNEVASLLMANGFAKAWEPDGGVGGDSWEVGDTFQGRFVLAGLKRAMSGVIEEVELRGATR